VSTFTSFGPSNWIISKVDIKGPFWCIIIKGPNWCYLYL